MAERKKRTEAVTEEEMAREIDATIEQEISAETSEADSEEMIAEEAEEFEVKRDKKAEKAEDAREQAEAEVKSLKARGVTLASKKTKRELYSSDAVIPIHDELSYSTSSEERQSEFQTLVNSQRAGKILCGTVVGMKMILDTPCAIVKYGNYFRVAIPYSTFIVEREHDKETLAALTPEKQLSHKRFLINQRIMSEVDFIVTAIDEESGAVIASRVAAMNKNKKYWYLGKAHSREGWLIESGQLLEGRVVVSTSDYAIVEARGIEKRLTARELAYWYISDVAEEFPVGSFVPVRVTIKKREEAGEDGKPTLSVGFSVRDAIPDERDIYIRDYTPQSLVAAVVVGITDKGIFSRIEDKKGKIDIFTPYRLYSESKNRRALPKLGQKVLVVITVVDAEKKQLAGEIIRTLTEER